MKNPYGNIVSFEDYKEIIGIPIEQQNNEAAINRINKWLVQATDQFDSMISGSGQLGTLYKWFNELKDNEEDNYKKYKLTKAICSWVETFVIKGKIWVDGAPILNSNIDIELNSSSEDSNVERKRKDIIQDLVSLGLYRTTNFGMESGSSSKNFSSSEIDELIVITKKELESNYLKIKPQKELQGPLDIANNDFHNGGNITGYYGKAKNDIRNYNIIESTIDFSKNEIIGKIPESEITNKVYDPIDKVYKFINQFGVEYFGGLTAEQIKNIVYASGVAWNELIKYRKDWIVQAVSPKNELHWFLALQDNINKNPYDNPDIWKELTTQEIDLNILMEQIKPLLPPLIKEEIEKLPQVNFISEANGEVIEFNGENEEEIQTKIDNFCNTYGIIQNDYLKEIQEEEQEIPDIDTTNLAKLNEQNTFTNTNQFEESVIFGSGLKGDYEYDKASGKLLAQSTNARIINKDNQLTTYEHVEQRIEEKTYFHKSWEQEINSTLFENRWSSNFPLEGNFFHDYEYIVDAYFESQGEGVIIVRYKFIKWDDSPIFLRYFSDERTSIDFQIAYNGEFSFRIVNVNEQVTLNKIVVYDKRLGVL